MNACRCGNRRQWLVALGAALAGLPLAAAANAGARRWYLEAVRMRALALSWGDQAYGAVLVAGDAVIGYGPSRVVKNRDFSAHAEREALRQALREKPGLVPGSILVSTARPCGACEHTAAQAGVARMVWGEQLNDAGAPRLQ